jgi:hypothetical protein
MLTKGTYNLSYRIGMRFCFVRMWTTLLRQDSGELSSEPWTGAQASVRRQGWNRDSREVSAHLVRMLTAGCGVRVGGWLAGAAGGGGGGGAGGPPPPGQQRRNSKQIWSWELTRGDLWRKGGARERGAGVKEVAVQRFGQVAWQGRLNLGDHKLVASPSMQMSAVTGLGACRHRH